MTQYEKRKEYFKEYYKKYNKEHRKEINARCRSSRKKIGSGYWASTQHITNYARLNCKKLADYTCKICGADKSITKMNAHHLLTWKHFVDKTDDMLLNLKLWNDQDNLICLCENCHRKIHQDGGEN